MKIKVGLENGVIGVENEIVEIENMFFGVFEHLVVIRRADKTALF